MVVVFSVKACDSLAVSYTHLHCLNVGLITRMIGRWLHMEKTDVNTLTIAGVLHDIGDVYKRQKLYKHDIEKVCYRCRNV